MIVPQTDDYRMSLRTDNEVSDRMQKNSLIETNQPKSSQLSYSQVIFSYRFVFAFLTPFLWMMHFTAMEPILAQRLLQLQLSQIQVGLFFCLLPFFYASIAALTRTIPKWIEPRMRIIVAITMTCLSFLCIGPSELLRFPDSILLMCIGQVLAGITGSQCLVSCLVEMIDDANARNPNNYEAVAALSTGIYRCMYGIAQMLGPVYGSTVNAYLGFKLTMDILAFLDLAFGIAYFVLAGGHEAFTLTIARYRQRKPVN